MNLMASNTNKSLYAGAGFFLLIDLVEPMQKALGDHVTQLAIGFALVVWLYRNVWRSQKARELRV